MLSEKVSNMEIYFYLNQEFNVKFEISTQLIGIDAGFIAENLYGDSN